MPSYAEHGPFLVSNGAVNTAINIERGSVLVINCEGELYLGGILSPTLTADGDDWATPSHYPAPHLRKNSLIWKVGDQWYQGGVRTGPVECATAGELILSVNDATPQDNTEGWNVWINVTSPISAAGHSSIEACYQRLGGATGFLGRPTSEEGWTHNYQGRFRHFEGGSLYTSLTTDCYEVHGDIRDKYAALGWERSFLGYPTTDELTTPDGIGRYNHFQGGSIYWSPQTGAFELHGAIRDKYAALGWERSFLGYPTTDELTTPDGIGRYNHFQGGSIYWSPQTGAQEVHGDIRARWAELGWERSFLGYPTTDELTTPDGTGRYNQFQFGMIVWTPLTGAQETQTMITDQAEWRRKHDGLNVAPAVPQPLLHFYPQTRHDLVDIVRRSIGNPDAVVRACGSHWGLSDAAMTTGYIVETRGFPQTDGFPSHPYRSALNNTLYNVIPECLSDAALHALVTQAAPQDSNSVDEQSYNYYHVEAGIRIFDLYSRLDLQIPQDDGQLTAPDHMPTSRHHLTNTPEAQRVLSGPWAMPTLGGAGGQTIVGAFSTGTHGGDQHLSPIADAVQAIHLIGADGNEYWIERPQEENLTNDVKLQQVYPGITIYREGDIFNSVLVSVGRMGIIYSVVLKVVRQYGLQQVRTKQLWHEVVQRLRNPSDTLFQSRFLQVVVNPHAKLNQRGEATNNYDCYVEQRKPVPLPIPPGLDAAGPIDVWEGRQCRTGKNAGRNPAIRADSMQSVICQSASAALIIDPLLHVVDNIKGALTAGAIATSPIWLPLPPPINFIAAGQIISDLTRPFDEIIDMIRPYRNYPGTLGAMIVELINSALARGNTNLVAMINSTFVDFGQPGIDRSDISYGIMDGWDYSDRNCLTNADSLTVSFNADTEEGEPQPRYLNFMDTLLLRINQLHAGSLPLFPSAENRNSFGGYVSMRFTGQSAALIAMQRWPRTCNIEIAGMKGINGTDHFLSQLEADAIALGATVHWGQRTNNEINGASQVQQSFPEIDRWRAALSKFTGNGRLTNFSTPFSRLKGLEVIQPRISSMKIEFRGAVLPLIDMDLSQYTTIDPDVLISESSGSGVSTGTGEHTTIDPGIVLNPGGVTAPAGSTPAGGAIFNPGDLTTIDPAVLSTLNRNAIPPIKIRWEAQNNPPGTQLTLSILDNSENLVYEELLQNLNGHLDYDITGLVGKVTVRLMASYTFNEAFGPKTWARQQVVDRERLQ